MLSWLQHALHTPFAAIARHLAGSSWVTSIFVAAIALVLAFRLARRLARLLLEVGLALAVLLTLTGLGWIHW
jgi:hypothetical protein